MFKDRINFVMHQTFSVFFQEKAILYDINHELFEVYKGTLID